MTRWRIIAATLAFAAVLATAGSADAFRRVVTGKNLAYLADRYVDLNNYPAQTLRIAKGKKGYVVRIDVHATTLGVKEFVCVGSLTINGVFAHPQASPTSNFICAQHAASLGPSFPPINLATSYWLDLDQAEGLSPGTFIGKPLDVTVTTSSNFGIGDTITVTAEMKKK